MRVLILESVSGGLYPKKDVQLLSEGFAMLRTMVNEFSEGGFDVVTTLDKRLGKLAGWLDADVFTGANGLSAALKSGSDAALAIAPEKGHELEEITSKLRKRGLRVLGSDVKSIQICANKWLTYRALRRRVPQPKTWKRPRNVGRILVKPIDGIGCEGVKFATSSSSDADIIFQEFLEGEHASCCLLMRDREGTALSVNRQVIAIRKGKFTYIGGAVPFDHPLKEKCAEIALKAAKSLGLCGYCGVDLVVGSSPFFIELNPRLTTSFVALARVLQANLGEILVRVIVNNETMPNPKIKGNALLRILKIKENVRVNIKNLIRLGEIPGVVSPPFVFNGNIQRNSPISIIVGSGNTLKDAERDLENTIDEVAALLEVDRDAIAWS